MKVKVTEKEVFITEISTICAGEHGINKCEFTLPASFKGLSVVAVFNNIPVLVTEGKCYIPSLPNGNCVFGVYAYSQKDGETEIMYSPKPTMFFVSKGSFPLDFSEVSIPEVFSYETYCRMLQDYWYDIIHRNTLPEYSPEATENQYYSARVLNTMYENLSGELEDVAALVGGGA